MPLGDSYATLAELKARMGIGGTAGDTRLAEALAAASRSIEKACSRQFNDAGSGNESARVYYPTHRCLVEVDDFHTTSGLVVKTDEGDDGSFETTWASADFQLEPLNGVLDGEGGWPFWSIVAVESRSFPLNRRASVQVTARWGWTAVPAPVKEATLIAAEELYRLKDAPFGVAGFADFGAIRIRENPMVMSKIAPYRRRTVLVG